MNTAPDHSENFIGRCKTFFTRIKTKITSRIPPDPLLKGIVILGSGTVISQVLGIIFVPIITRIYPPAIYGTLAVFSSLLSILIVGSSLRYELTIPIAEKDDDAEYLLILSFSIVCVLTIVLFVLMTFFGDVLAGTFHFEFISPYYWLFCIGFLGISVYQILTYWTLRSKDYILITRTRIAQSISGSVSKIILGVLSFGSFGLIGGEIIGRMVGIGTLGRTIIPRLWRVIRNFDMQRMRSLALRFKKFPTFSLPSSFINEISLQVPTLFISGIFGFQMVGLYSMCYSMLVLPVSFVSGSIAQVFFSESSELFRQKSDKMLVLYLQTTKKLFLFGAPLILGGAVVFPYLFPIVFGSAWQDAGMFSLPLSMMVIAQFVVSSTDRLELYGYNHWELAWNISRTCLVLSGFYLAYVFTLSPVTTVLVFSFIMTVMYVVNYILNIEAMKRVNAQFMKNATE
jgi:O-antigen/teichoic acid export membrane protein